jgi:putative sterol carrier protein
VIGSGETFPTVEDIIDQIDAIALLDGGKEYRQLSDQVVDACTALLSPQQSDVSKTGSAEKDKKGFETAAAVFEAMPAAFKPEAAGGVNIVFQYIISGANGGDWSCAVNDGRCTVMAGRHEKPTCTLKMADGDFLDMMNGKLKPMQAYTSGKLKLEGDIMKSQLIEKLFVLR